MKFGEFLFEKRDIWITDEDVRSAIVVLVDELIALFLGPIQFRPEFDVILDHGEDRIRIDGAQIVRHPSDGRFGGLVANLFAKRLVRLVRLFEKRLVVAVLFVLLALLVAKQRRSGIP